MTSAWFTIPLLICAMLIGHDVLMTGDPHAVAETHVSDHHTGDADMAADCHLREAARTTVEDFDDTLPALTLPSPPEIRFQSVPLPAWELAPRHPPGQLRAMLQVFLN